MRLENKGRYNALGQKASQYVAFEGQIIQLPTVAGQDDSEISMSVLYIPNRQHYPW
jgi:hypothetical protein